MDSADPAGGAVLWRDGPWRLVAVGPEGRGAYDAFVAAHPRGDFLQSWSWGELKADQGWRPQRVLLEREGEPRGAASLLERPLPLGLGRIVYAPRGPVVDYDDAEAVERMLLAVGRAVDARTLLVKLDPDAADAPDLTGRLRRLGLRPGRRRGLFGGIQPRHVMQLALDRPLDTVFGAFSPKCRYNIRLAGRHGVTVREATRDDLPAVVRLLRETALRDGFGLRPAGYYAEVFEHTVGAGHGRVLIATYGGEDVAATWTVHFGAKAWYLYGASSDRHRDKMPNYLLQWEAIRWAHGRGARLYDFLGVPASPNPRSPIVGLWRFKERFGARPVTFVGEFDLPLRPLAYRAWRLADPVYAHTQVVAGRARRAFSRLGAGAFARGPAPAPETP